MQQSCWPFVIGKTCRVPALACCLVTSTTYARRTPCNYRDDGDSVLLLFLFCLRSESRNRAWAWVNSCSIETKTLEMRAAINRDPIDQISKNKLLFICHDGIRICFGATEKHCVVSPHHKSFSQHLVVEWWRMNFQNSIWTLQFRWINQKWRGDRESFPANRVKPQNIFVTLERPRRTRRKWQHWVRHSLANRMASEQKNLLAWTINTHTTRKEKKNIQKINNK